MKDLTSSDEQKNKAQINFQSFNSAIVTNIQKAPIFIWKIVK